MEWTKLKDKKPSVEIDGKKILMYSIVNEGQKDYATQVFDTKCMIKFCNVNETWWMPLPKAPKE